MTKLRRWELLWLALLVGGAITSVFGASALAAEQPQNQTLTRPATVLDPFDLTSVEIVDTWSAGIASRLSEPGARQTIRIPPRLPERSAFKPSDTLG